MKERQQYKFLTSHQVFALRVVASQSMCDQFFKQSKGNQKCFGDNTQYKARVMKSLDNSIFLPLLSLVDARVHLCSKRGIFDSVWMVLQSLSVQRNIINLIKSQIQKITRCQKIKLSTYNWRWNFKMVTEVVWTVKRKKDTEEGALMKMTNSKEEQCKSVEPKRKEI